MTRGGTTFNPQAEQPSETDHTPLSDACFVLLEGIGGMGAHNWYLRKFGGTLDLAQPVTILHVPHPRPPAVSTLYSGWLGVRPSPCRLQRNVLSDMSDIYGESRKQNNCAGGRPYEFFIGFTFRLTPFPPCSPRGE